MEEKKTTYQLPKLPYDFSALEPVLSSEAVQIHYLKHHQAYVSNLNKSLDLYHIAERKKDMDAIVSLQEDIHFNGGGHINHTFFWHTLAPKNKIKEKPEGKLYHLIEENFVSWEEFQKEFNTFAGKIKGSGWAWLGIDKKTKQLEIQTTKNHDTIKSLGLVPLLVVDVWEHAYYLQYRNEKKSYLQAIWNILNWEKIEERFEESIK